MDTFPWFCASRSDDLSAVGGEQRKKRTKSEKQRPVGGCYCCRQSKGFSVPEVADLLGVKGGCSFYYGGPGTGGTCGAALRSESLRCAGCFVAACVRAGTFPGLVALAHPLHISRSVSVRGRLKARGARRRLGN